MLEQFGSEALSYVLGLASAKTLEAVRNARARYSKEWPVAIHIEDDLEIIFANTPPWVSAPMFVPDMDPLHLISPPASDALGVAMWARNELNGIPAGNSVIEITVRSKSPVEVVFDRVSVTAERFDPGQGVVLWQPVGGASLEYKRFEIELWDFVCNTRAVAPGGGPLLEHAATVAPGDPLRLQLQTRFANADDDALAYRWEASLHFLVSGKRKTIRLPRKQNEKFELVNLNFGCVP